MGDKIVTKDSLNKRIYSFLAEEESKKSPIKFSLSSDRESRGDPNDGDDDLTDAKSDDVDGADDDNGDNYDNTDDDEKDDNDDDEIIEPDEEDQENGGLYDMSHEASKPVFGVSDQVWHKPDCIAIQDGYRLEISDLGRIGIVLSM